MSYLLDSSVCIPFLKGQDVALVEKIKAHQPTELVLCSIVKAELLTGARKSRDVAKTTTLLNKFFDPFTSFPFDDKAAELYGTHRAFLEKAGTPIGDRDLMIASIALVHDFTVATRNSREFIRVPSLKVETW